jgi:rod shape-determining protein MreD
VRIARILLGLFLSVLGTLGLGTLRLVVAPDLFLLPVADAARGGMPVAAMLVGLAAGFLEDVLSLTSRLYGLHAFTKVLLGYLLATIGARTVVEKPVAVGGLVGGAVVLEGLLLFVLLTVLQGEAPPPDPLRLGLRALLTGALGAALHAGAAVPWRARLLARRRRKLQ